MKPNIRELLSLRVLVSKIAVFHSIFELARCIIDLFAPYTECTTLSKVSAPHFISIKLEPS